MSDHTFTTRDGQLWRAAFTDATEQLAADELGIRLADLAGRRPPQLVEHFERSLRARKPEAWALIYLACQDQAEARGVAPEGFAGLFTHAHVVAAILAVVHAIAARHPRGKLAAHLTRAERYGG